MERDTTARSWRSSQRVLKSELRLVKRRVVVRRLPPWVVYEDEACIALMDIQPVNLSHILVIPGVHASHLSELAENTGAKMFLTIAQSRQMLVLKGLEKMD